MSTESQTGAEPATTGRLRLSTGWAIAMVMFLAGLVGYAWIGFAYASSVGYTTPGGNWLESLLIVGIRVVGWPVLLAMHQ